MDDTVRVLIVEDIPTDAKLAEREIQQVLPSSSYQRVDTRDGFLEALESFQPDLIVTDYRMPQFDGLTALRLALERAPFTPVIILTGAINEDTAVACMKAGAADYVIKEHLKRLGQAVLRALEDKQLRLERRRAEEALRESEERFRSLYENASVGLYRTTPDGRILMANPAAVRMLGYSSFSELAQRNLEREGYAPDYPRSRFREQVESKGVVNGLENVWLRPDGSEITVRENARVVRDQDGTVLYYEGSFEDITEYKRAEEQVRLEAARAATLVRTAALLNATLDLQDALRAVCEETAKALDAPIVIIYLYDEPQDTLCAATALGIRPEHLEHIPRIPRKRLEQKNGEEGSTITISEAEALDILLPSPRFAELGIRSLNLSVMHYRESLIGIIEVLSPGEQRSLSADEKALFQGIADQAALAISNARLFTRQQRTEEALRQSEERYRTVSELTSDFAYAIAMGPEGEFKPEWTTEALKRITGYEPSFEDNVRPNWESLILAQDKPVAFQHLQANLAGETHIAEYRIVDRSGAIHWIRDYGQPVLEAGSGRVTRVIGAAQDITDQKLAEEQLLYQAGLLQNVSDAIVAVDLDFSLTSWNKAAESLYGWSAEEVIGKRIGEVVRLPITMATAVQWFQEHGSWQGELRQKRRDGTPIDVLASISSVRDGQGLPAGIIAVVRDITEHKRAEEARTKLEEQLRQSQKMEGLGRLAGGIAHDFNNLLTVIQGYCEIMHEKIPAESPLLEELEEIQRAGGRAATLTRQLLAFSRRQILAPTVIDVNTLISDLKKMFGRLIGEDITVRTSLAPNLQQITADPGQIEQVLMNLVVNARDAMPNGGTLYIRTDNVHLDEAHVHCHPESPVGSCVLLEVADTGSGMDEATRSRLFEPFFTTKNAKEGTGLGLATVYGIVKQSGGDILVSSEPGQGTTFRIYFPVSKSTPAKKPSASTPRAERGHGETILLVEDAQPLRNLVRQMLEYNGYAVLEARDGSDALLRAEAHDGPIHLLITDMVMPRISGRELAERLGPIRPDMRVLFMSGYTEDVMVRKGLRENQIEYLAKPFSAATLMGKIRELLDR
jgi:PAS domain S-box-containing protein